MMTNRRPRSTLAVLAWLLLAPATAADLAGRYTIALLDGDGQQLPIGRAQFERAAEGYTFEVVLDGAAFRDQFLSMRPFRCIDTPRIRICHQPYPYPLRRVITTQDLSALEYDLLFIFQTPEQYNSVDPWNGLYYRLRLDGRRLVGDLHAVDLSLIMAPPEAGIERPIGHTDITPVESDRQPFPRIVLRP